MWPEPYISAPAGEPRPEVVGHACAMSAYAHIMTVDVPIPSGVIVDDLLIAYAIGNPTSGTWSSYPSGWIEYQRLSNYGTSGGDGVVGPIAWKWVDGTEGATATFTWAAGAVPYQQKICIVVYRKVSKAMPFGALAFTTSSRPCVIPFLAPADTKPAIVGMTMGSTDTSGITVIDNGDVQTDTSMTVTGGPWYGSNVNGIRHILYYPNSNAEWENLLPYSHNNFQSPGWTVYNMTVTTPYYQSGDTRFGPTTSLAMQATAGATRKAIKYRKWLVAGQQYTFSAVAHIYWDEVSYQGIYLTVDDGTTETGAFYQTGVGSFAKTVDVGTPDNAYALAYAETGTAIPSYLELVFTPTTTGWHDLWFGRSSTDGVLTQTGSGDLTVLYALTLRRGYFAAPLHETPSFRDGAIYTGHAGTNCRIMYENTSTDPVNVAMELRRDGAAGAPITLVQRFNKMEHVMMEGVSGNYDVSGARVAYRIPAYYQLCWWYSSSPAYPASWGIGTPDKVYFEVTAHHIQSNVLDTVAVAMVDTRCGIRQSSNYFGNVNEDFAYFCDGLITEDGVSAGTFATWTDGDIIGCGIDWASNTFNWYKNGTLIRTSSFNGKWARLAMVVCEHNGAPGTALNKVTANFAGPFSYKPTGYSAFDYEHEAP